MLNCRACLWRCMQALDTAPTRPTSYRRNVVSTLQFGHQRLFRTASSPIRKVTARPGHLAEVERVARARAEPWRRSTQAAGFRQKEKKTLTAQRAPPRNGKAVTARTMMKVGIRKPTTSTKDWNVRKKELRHLSDPLELAGFVKQELGKGRDKEMVELVQMASHSMQCIVGWNHIIDYYLAQGRVSRAFKVYNDMKNRAQFPDSYTYTILLRGLSINAHESGVVGKALSVYHSLSAHNSRVEASIIHTNAVLKVCARAMDMDALWGVAAKIPARGPGAANAITYATILNAIHQSMVVNVPTGETEEEVAARRERGVMEGRRVWEDVIKKWRNADLILEEELVCAMGRLLLIGARPRDWDDVLSLVEQTMDLPRLVPRLGTAAREQAGLPRLRAPNVPEQYRFDDDHLSPTKTPMRGDEFLPIPVDRTSGPFTNSLSYAQPGNNTLSMVQEACQKVVAIKAADEYWTLLTDPGTYNIVPDVNNLHARLRMLRQNRSSARAVETLRNDFLNRGLQPRPGTFRIAMSTCVRDKNNHNSLKHAGQILDMMNKTLEDVDPKTVIMYASLTLDFPLATGQDFIDSLTRLDPILHNIKIQLGVGAAPRDKRVAGAYPLNGTEKQDALMALRKIYAVMDKLILSDMVSEEQKKGYKVGRAKLGSLVRRLMFKSGGKERVNEGEDTVDEVGVESEQGGEGEKSRARKFDGNEKRVKG
ncbi:hypothetical protein B0J11DRAFT_501205 [Dendryphion nanum]|uniref:Pentatricopeptide repeat protein n=1 Tax=Dendryphion nanum TaxID=256645 RepID=A0A9P9IYZ1_9PLEO|nr:hypothetical protein B0J11DRAFT_501205 [Dendryphion nanum]